MKYLLFLFSFFLLSSASAQHSAAFEYYSIDSLSVDSFFLKTTTVTTVSGSPRKDTLISYRLFSDTTEFVAFLQGKYDEIQALGTRFLFLQEERDTLSERYDRLLALGGGAESPFRNMLAPPENTAEIRQGFWVVYSLSEMEYLYDISKVRRTCTILFPDGSSRKIKAKKKK